jgi:tetratricopeptide (TPR) repeat protein
MIRDIPPPLALTLLILLRRAGWSQEELAVAFAKKPETVSVWIRTGHGLTRKKLEVIARHIGFEVGEIDRTLDYLAGKLPVENEEIPGYAGLTPGERAVVREVRAQVMRNALAALDADLPRQIEEARLHRARAQAEGHWQALRVLPAERQRIWIDQNSACWTPAFVARVCDASEMAAGQNADRALALARLALYLAERVPGEVSCGCRGFSWAFIANAHRVGGKLRAATTAFDTARELWDTATCLDPALDPVRFLSLEASLRREQREYDKALALLDRALVSADPREEVNLLLKKAHVQHYRGQCEESIRTLRLAESKVEPERDARSWFAVQFNLAANECRLNRHQEARALLPAIEKLAETIHGELGLLRLLWLRALTASGLGEEEDAARWLEQVRQAFVDRNNPFDAALASLDLAEVYLKQARWPEVRFLAEEMFCIFQRQGVHEQALKALQLFREAVQRQEVTVALIRKLAQYLREARHDPAYSFAR